MNTFDAFFKQLYITYFAKLKRFACEYVISEEEAENIIHDVFMNLWENQNAFLLAKNKVGLLFSSVRNRCIDHLRHQTIERRTVAHLQQEFDETLQIKLNSLEVLDEPLFVENIEDIVSKAIANLPEKCRIIFIKNKIEGMKQKDIAQELNISVNTVESQMAIAYKKLKEELQYILPLSVFFFFLLFTRMNKPF